MTGIERGGLTRITATSLCTRITTLRLALLSATAYESYERMGPHVYGHSAAFECHR
jgi:hypothetical protein